MKQTLIFNTTTLVIQSVEDITHCADTAATPKLLERQRATTIMILEEIFGQPVQISHHSDGAPFIAAMPHLSLSISHCQHFVAVAIDATRTVGVDIEEPRHSQLRRVIKRVLLPGEDAYLATDSTMLRAWTLKEALFKASTGMGYKTIAQIPIPPPDAENCMLGNRQFSIYTLTNIGYTGCALALVISD